MLVSTRQMRALVYEGPKIMNMRTVPVPVPAEDEVLLKVEKVGICGSELSGYLGHNSLRVPPLVMGHEFSGTIEEIGAGVSGLRQGDRVTANPLVSCGRCADCLSGNANLCGGRKLIGAGRPGAFAEYVTVPARNVYPLPDRLSIELGAMTEPFACAVHICRLVQLNAVDRLFISGAGPIGLFVLQAAKVFGVTDIVIQDINPERLHIAGEMGARTVSSPELLKEAAPRQGFDVAVDAVGLDVTRQQCITVVKPGGRVVFSGLHSADSVIPANLLVRNEVKIFGSFSYNPADFQIALDWLADRKADLLPWTADEPLENGGECFERLLGNPGKVAKILLSLSGGCRKEKKAMTEISSELSAALERMPLFSMHEHHKEDAFHATLDLGILLANSYVGWCSLPRNRSAEERAAWLQNIRFNSYYVWLEKALKKIYQTDTLSWTRCRPGFARLTATRTAIWSCCRKPQDTCAFFRTASGTRGATSDIRRWRLRYTGDPWLSAYTPDIVENNIAHSPLGGGLKSMDAFEEALLGELKMRRSSVAALKCAIAYERSIDFEPVDRSDVLPIYGKNPERLTEREKKKFGDYVFSLIVAAAGQLDLPVQIHTGLARLGGSSPLQLEQTIARHPATTFVLFHGGSPWIYETAGLAHNYPNVVLDINWLPLISTSAAVQALHVYMEALPSAGRITWGGDCWTSEEAVGASMAFRYVLRRVLTDKVADGYFGVDAAVNFASKIMYRNAQEIYGIRMKTSPGDFFTI